MTTPPSIRRVNSIPAMLLMVYDSVSSQLFSGCVILMRDVIPRLHGGTRSVSLGVRSSLSATVRSCSSLSGGMDTTILGYLCSSCKSERRACSEITTRILDPLQFDIYYDDS